MNLGVSYNFFNGEEHLLASIKSIRDSVDFVCLVYQNISNKGNNISEEALDTISDLRSNKLVDNFYCYHPNLYVSAQENEIEKRKIGLNIVRKMRMSHFMTMDADEFYRKTELDFAKEFIAQKNILNSTVHSYMHIKSPTRRALDTTLVPFITKITHSTALSKKYFVKNVDPTRRFVCKSPLYLNPFKKSHYLFPHNVVAMYHMNLVRKDNLKSKLQNSSTNNSEFFNQLMTEFNNWNCESGKFYFPGKGLLDVRSVPNEFNAWDPGE